ncbi:DNA polymerase III subunit epsilon [Lutibacter sp. HS1-25]|uniref:exonuclease domain-containing protein n=1 Tax=Lutibacter sp. HS1-25 TaxID=2485000 RepID=UPI001011E2C3|nr:exonuclease domain-containing protein [Lutibacter sp. HS1-25]RXP57643.1 DNA polymerase III subunit epsilon [Lutibacter sp. HS1-25]
MYAILDIETTGGKFNEEGITEIAIYKFDGHEIVDQFISLVNPEKDIQPFVINLTGINNEMVKNAPKFHEVAKRIVEITTDCVLVAHNADFDNRILTTEFRRLGYNYDRKTLCTVELSKTLIPELPSYKLGNLCKSLGIPISSRHRADGDAIATVLLFKLLLAKDIHKNIIKEAVITENPRKLASKLLTILDELPSKTGLFYVHNCTTQIMYIGKGKNIRKAVNQLFLRASKKAQTIQKNVVSVTYEETGNELIAQLKFNEEIKTNKPKYNFIAKVKEEPIEFSNDNLLIIDRGRTIGEKSVILIENNEFKGYCYTDFGYQLSHLEILRKLISPMDNSISNRNIIKKYLQKNNIEKIIRF